jgi:aminoglycoside 6'-N-acetyltransferase
MEIAFRPLERGDLPAFARWLADAEVSRWWPDRNDLASLEAAYGPCIDGGDPTQVFVVVVNGIDAGIAERYLVADNPDWGSSLLAAVPDLADVPAAGMDYLIGVSHLRGRGVGTAMVAAFAARALADLPVDLMVVSVQQDNRASWRALERAGFQRVWAGRLEHPDPSDAGPAYVLVHPVDVLTGRSGWAPPAE